MKVVNKTSIKKGGGRRLLKKSLFSFDIEIRKHFSGQILKKYLVIKILFLKLKFNIYEYDFLKSNKIFIDNKLITPKERKLLKNCNFNIFGCDNEINLENIDQFNNLTIDILGANNKITIKKSAFKIDGLYIKMTGGAKNQEVLIEEDAFINGCCSLIMRRNGFKITIGKNCIIAYGVTLTTTDWHGVYDNKTKELLNPDENVIIKNNVWLGQDALISKGTIIPDGCIVGAKSFVNKKFDEPNCIIAGVPAKIVKRDVHWER